MHRPFVRTLKCFAEPVNRVAGCRSDQNRQEQKPPADPRGNSETDRDLERFEQHLADNSLKLREMTFRLGPRLEFDPGPERFASAGKANAMLTRDYRAPYVVPARL